MGSRWNNVLAGCTCLCTSSGSVQWNSYWLLAVPLDSRETSRSVDLLEVPSIRHLVNTLEAPNALAKEDLVKGGLLLLQQTF